MPEVPQGEQLEYLSEGPDAAADGASPTSSIHPNQAQEERDRSHSAVLVTCVIMTMNTYLSMHLGGVLRAL